MLGSLNMTDLSPEHAAQLRKRVLGSHAAEVRERQLRTAVGSLAPADALEAAPELWELMHANARLEPLRE